MDNYYYYSELAVNQITEEYEINNLMEIKRFYDGTDYWDRLANLSFFGKLFNEYHYHFLYEIQSLSNQIHFGIVNCILFKDRISTIRGKPNIYNHRYTFMVESTIHCIYSYWNRVGLALNTYLIKPIDIKHTYFTNVIQQIVIDYPTLINNDPYQWICIVNGALKTFDRNEFAHNNSLIMQNFLSGNSEEGFEKLRNMTNILLSHNKFIVNEIYNLVSLLENLESIIESK